MKPLDRVLRDHARPVLAEAGFQRKGRDFWLTAGREKEQTCGEQLARVLREDVVPLLTRCLDRAEFLRLCRDPAKPLDLAPKDAEPILLVDDGPSAELTATLAKLDALPPKDFPVAAEYAAWLRNRAAAARPA